MPNKLVLIMGVSGTGKSTIAKAIAKELNYTYLDADDFHSKKAKEMMANGQAIDDKIRQAWIENMLLYLANEHLQNKSFVLAYSGLKQVQREKFTCLDTQLINLFLHGEQQLIAERMNQREAHFFPTHLLSSQFQALELPEENKENVSLIDIDQPVANIVKQCVELIIKGRSPIKER